ncbi:MAG: hypothetical protein ACYTXE_45660, partial [Nostoc sp.]
MSNNFKPHCDKFEDVLLKLQLTIRKLSQSPTILPFLMSAILSKQYGLYQLELEIYLIHLPSGGL